MNDIMKDEHYAYVDNEFRLIPTVDDSLRSLKYRFDKLYEELGIARKTIEEMKSEHWKDIRLQEMQAELDKAKANLYRGFDITEEEDRRIREWKNTINSNKFKVGGCYKYIFEPTALGTVGRVVNELTKEEFIFRELC